MEMNFVPRHAASRSICLQGVGMVADHGASIERLLNLLTMQARAILAARGLEQLRS
ncbi:hypothetical protein [Microvirga sp. G4-2]|uniref:hypothetical protein n=1 Tax=Microvirga sp. G4-2 TaxID=3434467 RepID=UPI0040448DF4